MNWAWRQQVPKSSSKFILVAMGNLADDNMVCWPSCKALAQMTSQDIKTVEAGLRRLRDDGFIADTGKRKGETGQVIVYQLNTTKNGGVKASPKTPEIPPNTPENGGVSDESKTPVFPDNTPVFPVKDPQISRERPPKTGDGHHKDTTRTPKTQKKSAADRVDLLVGVDPQVIDDYLQVRKAKKAGVLTATAVSGMAREAQKAGLSLAQAVEFCAESGWQGFNAGWYAQRQGTAKPQPKNGSRHSGFDQRNYEGAPDGSIPA